MTKKELQEFRSIGIEIQQLEEQIARLESALTSPKVQIITDMPKGSRQGGDMEARIAKLLEYRESRNKLWDELIKRQEAVNKAIDSLPDAAQRAIMRYRYIQGLKWSEICGKIGYEWAQIHRIHNRAIEFLQDIKSPPK